MTNFNILAIRSGFLYNSTYVVKAAQLIIPSVLVIWGIIRLIIGLVSKKKKEKKSKVIIRFIIQAVIALFIMYFPIAFVKIYKSTLKCEDCAEIWEDCTADHEYCEYPDTIISKWVQAYTFEGIYYIFNPEGPSLKPIIYIYPEEESNIKVTLPYKEYITVSYPKYVDGWDVKAYPDGTLIDNNTGRELYSLYYEADYDIKPNKNEGFIVKGEDSASFLEEKLEILGLNAKESEEFIVYWLPKLEENKYNYIYFATNDELDKAMPLEFSKDPNTLIRILMMYKPLDKKINIKEQKLTKTTRSGYSVIEWGGRLIK